MIPAIEGNKPFKAKPLFSLRLPTKENKRIRTLIATMTQPRKDTKLAIIREVPDVEV
jgi:hypothetical protein